MNSLTKTFNFENSVIRTAGTFENPMFCLKDVCSVLGTKRTGNVSSALAPKYKGVVLINTPGGRQDMVFVTEPGLYKVLVRSRSKKAEKFQDWLCEEVVPSIRKTGKFELEQQRTLEYKKVDLDYLKFARETFPNCERMKHLIKEKIASAIHVTGQLAIAQPLKLTVSEVLERNPAFSRGAIYKHRSRFGKLVAGDWRKEKGTEPQKMEKLVNSHTCKVNCYPHEYHERIREQWVEFMSDN